jgi:hypothetical protein
MRAIRYAMLLAVLCIGLPGIAFAHGDHSHANALPSQAGLPQAAVSSALPQVQYVGSVAEPVQRISIAAAAQTSQYHEVVSARSLTKSCAGECCCIGMSNCNMGSCCYSSIMPAVHTLDFPSSPDLLSHHLYRSTALLMILGFDRPPKA